MDRKFLLLGENHLTNPPCITSYTPIRIRDMHYTSGYGVHILCYAHRSANISGRHGIVPECATCVHTIPLEFLMR